MHDESAKSLGIVNTITLHEEVATESAKVLTDTEVNFNEFNDRIDRANDIVVAKN